MKKMYKIFGAVAIIGLFLLGSVASTSVAAPRQQNPVVQQEESLQRQAQPQQPQQQPPEIPDEATSWDGSGDLPYWDGDGQDGGMYLYDVYDIDGLQYDTSPCPIPEPEDLVNPQYIAARIMIYRGDDWPFELNSKFKTRIRNIGAPHIGLGPEIEISAFHPLTLGYRHEEKQFILPIVPYLGFRDLEIEDAMLWYFTGGTCWVHVDPENDINEYYDGILSFRPRFRWFVGNLYCPAPYSIGYFNV